MKALGSGDVDNNSIQKDFNTFVLGGKERKQEHEEQIIEKNLLTLNKHTAIYLRVCKINYVTSASENKFAFYQALKNADEEMRI